MTDMDELNRQLNENVSYDALESASVIVEKLQLENIELRRDLASALMSVTLLETALRDATQRDR